MGESIERNAGISLYEFNKENMKQFPILETEEELQGAKNQLISFLSEMPSKYYMLLNHDIHYFTLFRNKECFESEMVRDVMFNDILDCLCWCGDNEKGIIEVCRDNSGYALEFWVKDLVTNETMMFLLFDYEPGVIEYHKGDVYYGE